MQSKRLCLTSNHIGFHNGAGGGGQSLHPAVLFQTAADPADALERTQGLHGGAHIGGLAVVDVKYAANLRDPLRAMGQPFKRRKRGLHNPRRQSQRPTHAISAGRILMIMRTRQTRHLAEINRGRLPAFAELT